MGTSKVFSDSEYLDRRKALSSKQMVFFDIKRKYLFGRGSITNNYILSETSDEKVSNYLDILDYMENSLELNDVENKYHYIDLKKEHFLHLLDYKENRVKKYNLKSHDFTIQLSEKENYNYYNHQEYFKFMKNSNGWFVEYSKNGNYYDKINEDLDTFASKHNFKLHYLKIENGNEYLVNYMFDYDFECYKETKEFFNKLKNIK